MGPLKIASLNVNGLNDAKRDFIFQTLIRKRIDIALLQEIHPTAERIAKCTQEWQQLTNCTAIFSPPENNTGPASRPSRGVAILFGKDFTTPNISNQSTSIPGRSLSIQIDIEGKPHKILNTYAPNDPAQRRDFFNEIIEKENTPLPIIWGGDHNCVENPTLDRRGGGPPSSYHTAGATQIHIFTTMHQLVDPFRTENPNTRSFTYTHFRTPISGLEPPQTRLDRIYIPKYHLNKHKTTMVPLIDSDHAMVVCKFTPKDSKQSKKGPGVWKFNAQLLEDQAFIQSTNEVIDARLRSENDFTNPTTFWESLKASIKQHSMAFSREKHQREQRDLNAALAALNAEENKPTPSPTAILSLQNTIAQLERDEIQALLLHTKLDQIELDEKPSAYFYQRLKDRAKKSTIEELTGKITINDETRDYSITDQTQILTQIHKFYTNLYDLHQEEICEEAQTTLLNRVVGIALTDNTVRGLEADLSLQELEAALKSMKNRKTPGLDGLPAELYKKFHGKLLPPLLKIAQHSAHVGQLSNTQRKAVVTLIHKKDERANLANWRPISLLCVDYKIIAKALALRLQPVLAEIINPDQTCGIPGRSINDNIWMLRDLIDYATEKQEPAIRFTLDQEKAFDRVNHTFLVKVLEKYGFGPNFCNWIKTLYTASQSFIQNNGNLTLPVQIQRGVRQGCPISAYLYVIVAETLAHTIRIDTQIKGFKLPKLLPPSPTEQVKVSQYADDTCVVIAYNQSQQSLTRLYEKFELYQKASGSKLNTSKCKAFVFGGNTPHTTNASIATHYNQQNPEAPVLFSPIEDSAKILGIWYHPDPKTTYTLNYEPLADKIQKKLDQLKQRRLSLRGRCLALNTLVLSKLWYVAGVVPLTNANSVPLHRHPNLLSRINHHVYGYLIHGPHLPRAVYQLPPKKGGVGIQNIATKALALRSKQINQILDRSCKKPSTRLARYWLAKGIQHEERQWTSFLRLHFPTPAPPRNRGYKALIDLFHGPTGTRLYKDPRALPTCKQIYEDLMKEDQNPHPPSEDKWRRDAFPTPAWENCWKTPNTPLQQEKRWRLQHQVLLHQGANTCAFCQHPHPPTHIHLFAECANARQIWEIITPIITLINPPNYPQTTKHLIVGLKGRGTRITLANTLITDTVSEIWFARNALEHENKRRPPHTIAKMAIASFQKNIQNQFKIFTRNNDIEGFRAKFLLLEIARIQNGNLTFRPDLAHLQELELPP